MLNKFLRITRECFDNLLEFVHHSMKINERQMPRDFNFPSDECGKINDVVSQALVMNCSIRRNNWDWKELQNIEHSGIHLNLNSPDSNLISDVNSCQAGTANLPQRLLWIRDYRMIKCFGTKGWLFGAGGIALFTCSVQFTLRSFRIKNLINFFLVLENKIKNQLRMRATENFNSFSRRQPVEDSRSRQSLQKRRWRTAPEHWISADTGRQRLVRHNASHLFRRITRKHSVSSATMNPAGEKELMAELHVKSYKSSNSRCRLHSTPAFCTYLHYKIYFQQKFSLRFTASLSPTREPYAMFRSRRESMGKSRNKKFTS